MKQKSEYEQRIYRFSFPLNAKAGLEVGEEKILVSQISPHTKPYPPNGFKSNKGDNFLYAHTWLLFHLSMFSTCGEKGILFIDP